MEARRVPPYHPLWVYRFFAFIDRLPVPGWLLCLLIIVIVAVLNHLVAWQQGTLPFGQLNVFLSSIGLYIVLGPFLWTLLTQRAYRALQGFLQGSGKSQAQVAVISSDFNSLPDWEMILLLTLGLLFGYFVYYNVSVPMEPLSAQVLPPFNLLGWLISMAFVYPILARAVRQISFMKNLLKNMKINIFNPQPIYALSRYASLIGIILLIALYGLQLIVFPSLLFTPSGVFLQIVAVAVALSLFFVPLADVNRGMHRAKEGLLSELGEDLTKVQQRAHNSIARKTYTNISDMRNAVSMLKEEMEIVQKVRTSPWQTETLRNLFTPLLIPILVYLLQRVLGGVLGLQ